MLISNINIYDSIKATRATITISGNKIVDIADCQPTLENVLDGNEQQILDATGLTAIPGLIDIHTHGCAGHDFCDGTQEALEAMANYELSKGIVAFCPTSMTLPENQLTKIFANATLFKERQARGEVGGAKLIGINMEGPFVSPEKLGAQNPEYQCNPDIKMFRRLQKAAKDFIKIVTIAPELPGAMEFIDKLHNEVHISIGHTNASYETTLEAIKRGADHATHLYNAMSAFTHRSPGAVGAILASSCTSAELICDGVHLHPAVVDFTHQQLVAKETDKALPIFISDSMEATGLPDGKYQLGGLDVIKKGNKATLTDGKTIAGSVSNLMDCLRWTVNNTELSLADAVFSCSLHPAIFLNMAAEEYGMLEPGFNADLVLLDQGLNVKYVIQQGKVVYENI